MSARAAVRLVREDRTRFAAVLATAVAAAVLALAAPALLGRIVDAVQAHRGSGPLTAAVLLCAAAQTLVARYASRAAHRFGERAVARTRERYVDRVLDLPSALVERVGPGDLTARGTADVDRIGATVRSVGPDVLVAALRALFTLGAVLVLSPLLGAVAVVALSGIWFAARWYLRRARAAYLAEGAAGSAVAEQLASTSAGARTVEALGLGPRRLAVCDAAVAELVRARMRTLHLRSVLFPAVDISYVLPVVAALLLGGLLHAHGVLSLGAVVAAALYLRQLSEPLDVILQQLESVQSAAASFARVEGAAAVPSPPAPARRSAAPEAGAPLTVRGARFAYGGGPEVLGGVDLTIRPGERLALVGPSGAGKTTLARLLAGMDAPTSGAVEAGGVPVAGLAPEQLRRHVVLVTQEHHVFLGTVRENLRLAAAEADDALLHRALAAVGADGWAAELPNGLDTRLGAGAHRLDGPQAQQLALARVVLADPHTVILDEATALLDAATARRAERSLAAVLAGRTVVAVAHRLHTARDADRVAVLAAGRLVELGPHQHLVAAGGTYADLWHTWHGDGAPAG